VNSLYSKRDHSTIILERKICGPLLTSFKKEVKK